MDDTMIPAMRDLLNQLRDTARSSFGHRRGSAEAREYAETIERGYGSASDHRVRQEIAEICAFLRNP